MIASSMRVFVCVCVDVTGAKKLLAVVVVVVVIVVYTRLAMLENLSFRLSIV